MHLYHYFRNMAAYFLIHGYADQYDLYTFSHLIQHCLMILFMLVIYKKNFYRCKYKFLNKEGYSVKPHMFLFCPKIEVVQ